MEFSFSDLRAKEVINTQDGRKLGKVCDLVLSYPENKWLGVVVPGKRGFTFKKTELFIEMRNIVKIGEDVILVNVGFPRPPKSCDCGRGSPIPPQPHAQGRNYEEFE